VNALSHHGAVRAGHQPSTTRSARGLRLRLAVIWATVFFVLSGLLAWGAAETEAGDTQLVIIALSTACFLGFCAALADAARMVLGRRHERQRSAAA
jgi:hypothetical protein